MAKREKVSSSSKKESQARPDIYRYHDYREVLKVWLEYKKNTESRFSLRALAKQSNLAVGYLSMILSGDRRMPHETLEKIAKPLGLNPSEKSYLELLRTVAESESLDLKHEALEKLRRFRAYRELNVKEVEVYQYLTRWYYVAIRELAHLKNFQADPKWIQKKLKTKISLKEAEEALSFLFGNGYLEKLDDDKVKVVDKELLCLGGVYRLALAQFHREMLELAMASLENTKVEDRDITGYTLAIPKNRLGELKKMCFNFLRQVAQLEDKSLSPDSVYHVAVAAFPLTEGPKE
ncbi:MAG: TIGR02147 family protein [Deltaproteobacteria bacterium]